MTKSFNEDLLSMEDLLEVLASKGYTYDDLIELLDTGVDNLGLWEDEFEDDDGSDVY